MSEIAGKQSLTRARVTQIMNLLKLPAEMQEFLVGGDDPREIKNILRGDFEGTSVI